MIKQILSLVVFFTFFGLNAQDWSQTIDSLIIRHQYLSGFKLMWQQDSNAIQPELELKKVELAINYYTASNYHRSFGFTNLRRGESIEQLREQSKQNDATYYYPVDSVLLDLIERYPQEYRIHLALGLYYNEVFLLFGDRWGRKAEWQLEQSKFYIEIAYRNGVYDAKGLYLLGYYHTLTENYHEARYWFNRSLQLEDAPLTNYNLAVACLFDGMFSEGVPAAAKSFELFNDSLKKGDAARITGILYSKQENQNKALEYFQLANLYSPGYKPNQLYLLKTYLTLGFDKEAQDLAGVVLCNAVYKPDIPQEFLDMFEQENKQELLRDVFNYGLDQFSADDEAQGNILFHYAKLEYNMGNKHKSKQYLKQANVHFRNVFDEGHQVFQAIDQMLNEI